MATTAFHALKHSFIAFLALILVERCQGLATSNTAERLLSKIQSQIIKKSEPAPKTLLERLDLVEKSEPKTFAFKFAQIPDLVTASFPLVMRLGTGVFADGYRVSLEARDKSRYTVLALGDSSQVREISNIRYSKQNQPIILYEFEGCPFCRKVREAVSILSLEITFRPCPKGERNYRTEVKTKYGDETSTFPFLIDPNTGVQMFESDDIINYLYSVYGTTKSEVPKTLSPSNPLVPLSAGLGMLPRLGRGATYRTSFVPPEPLTLWAYEGSPFCKIVRERLVELAIPHTQISCPRGSFQRDRLYEKTGRFQVPYLEDPNTDVNLFESAAIIEYLEKVYGLPAPTVKYL